MKRVALVGIVAGLGLVACGNNDEGSARQESQALSQVGAPVVQDVEDDESSQFELEQAATDVLMSRNPDLGPSECIMFRDAADVYGWDVARSQFIANAKAAYEVTSGGVTLSTAGANYMLDTVLGFC